MTGAFRAVLETNLCIERDQGGRIHGSLGAQVSNTVKCSAEIMDTNQDAVVLCPAD